MGNLKRFLAMTLTMLMVVGCFAMTGSVAAFDDVVDYQQQINLMSTLKIIEGYSEDEFAPDNDVERWHMALWIAKIMTGKVDDAYVNWYSTSNNTDFADLAVDHFYGSISYCNENGVVIGTSATTFEPAEGIMIQDVFTMVVRMLGYGSSSMDANYPWSYIDKAIQLGLDEGLVTDYNNEDVATREQSAVVLYNALFAKKADGTTYAESKFNLTMDTVVLTGTSKANMFETGDVESKKLAGEKYVAFNALNDDGTLGSETFYLLKSWFGFDEDYDENLYFGQSYKVITKDNYTSLIYCEAIEGYWVDQTDFDGVKDSNADIKIEGKTYKAVLAHTLLNNNQGRKATDDLEVIVYNTNGRKVLTLATSYVMDAKRNILDSDGKILLEYNETLAATVSNWKDAYLYKRADGTYVTASEIQWDKAAKYDHTKTASSAMQLVGKDTGFKSHDLYNKNAYSDTVLYDDNSDGIYDRAMYTYYKFGFISYNDDSYLTINGSKIFGDTKYTSTDITYVTADGEVLDAADVVKALDSSLSKGNYVLYTYNTSNKYVMIKEFFTPNSGLVTSIDKTNSTITFDQVYYNVSTGNVTGSKFTLGNAKLDGATKDTLIDRIPDGDLEYLQGRNVHYIEKDGNVLAIYEAYNNSGKYLVFDSIVGMSSTGYVNALVYSNSNVRSVVTIASVSGNWYSTYNTYYTIADALSFGDLFSYTTDALGNYHVTYMDPDSDYTYYYKAINWKSFTNVSIEFTNGIAVPIFNGHPVDGISEFSFFDNGKGVAIPFEQFNTNADTVIVALDGNGTLNAYKGIPANGASISVYNEDNTWYATNPAKIFVSQTNDDDPSVAKFIYIKNASFTGTTTTAWNTTSNDTVVFIDKTSYATEVITNQTSTGYGVTLGSVYSYNKAIDFVRGGVKNNILVYNSRLTAGNFYSMKDNYVDALVTNNTSYVNTGYLQYINTYEAVWTYNNGEADRTNYRTNYLYELTQSNNDITDVSSDDSNPKNMLKSKKDSINADGAYAPVYYYAGTLDSAANVFIYTTITAGTTTRNYYKRYDWVEPSIDIVEFTRLRKSGLNIEILLETYDYTRGTDLYSAFNWYEITSTDYQNLSAAGIRANDAYNTVIDYLGTNVLLKKGTTNVSGFNDDNVLAFTQIMYTNGGGYRYFLVLTSNPAFNSTRVGDGKTYTADADKYTLIWNNGLTTYSLKLDSVGIEAARVATLSSNIETITGSNPVNLQGGKNRLNVPTLYANYSEMITGEDQTWADRWFNYVGAKFNNSFIIDQVIGTWAGTLYLEVPTYTGYTYTVEAYYYDGYTDGTGVPTRWTLEQVNVKYTSVAAVGARYAYDAYQISVPSEENLHVVVTYKKVETVTISDLNSLSLYVLSNGSYNGITTSTTFNVGETYTIFATGLSANKLYLTYDVYDSVTNSTSTVLNKEITGSAATTSVDTGYLFTVNLPAGTVATSVEISDSNA